MNLSSISEADIMGITDSNAGLTRGLNYYKDGRVESIKNGGRSILAKVEGRHTYKVKISIKEGRLLSKSLEICKQRRI